MAQDYISKQRKKFEAGNVDVLLREIHRSQPDRKKFDVQENPSKLFGDIPLKNPFHGLTDQINTLSDAIEAGIVDPSNIDLEVQRSLERLRSILANSTTPLQAECLELAKTYPISPIFEASKELENRPKSGFDWCAWAFRHYGIWIDAKILEAKELDRLHPMPQGTTSVSRSLKNQLNRANKKLTDVFAPRGRAADRRFTLNILLPDEGSSEAQEARVLSRHSTRAYRKILK